MDLTFKGKATNLADIDIPRIGHQIGVGEDELHAFMDVEAAGSPWDAKGRPKMLFEPHVFYRLLGKGAKRDRAVREGLAYPKWGEKPYPRDSYPRLSAALKIDADKALMSCSWGLTQIMGQWHQDCGYATPHAMVLAFSDSAAAHLDATVKLLKAWKIDDDLRAHRWVEIAKVWNGPAHAKHNYAGRMKTAFEKWRKIRDTPFDPAKDLAPTAPAEKPASAPKPVPPVDPRVPPPDQPVEETQGGLVVLFLAIAGVAGTLWASASGTVCNIFGVLCQ